MLVVFSGLKPWFSSSVSSEEKCADFGKDVLTGNNTLDGLLRDLCRWPAERSVGLGDDLDLWDSSSGWMPSSKQDVDHAWTIFLYSLTMHISAQSIGVCKVGEVMPKMLFYNQPQQASTLWRMGLITFVYHRFIVTLTLHLDLVLFIPGWLIWMLLPTPIKPITTIHSHYSNNIQSNLVDCPW